MPFLFIYLYFWLHCVVVASLAAEHGLSGARAPRRVGSQARGLPGARAPRRTGSKAHGLK